VLLSHPDTKITQSALLSAGPIRELGSEPQKYAIQAYERSSLKDLSDPK